VTQWGDAGVTYCFLTTFGALGVPGLVKPGRLSSCLGWGDMQYEHELHHFSYNILSLLWHLITFLNGICSLFWQRITFMAPDALWHLTTCVASDHFYKWYLNTFMATDHFHGT
jgi:hypothetical protein